MKSKQKHNAYKVIIFESKSNSFSFSPDSPTHENITFSEFSLSKIFEDPKKIQSDDIEEKADLLETLRSIESKKVSFEFDKKTEPEGMHNMTQATMCDALKLLKGNLHILSERACENEIFFHNEKAASGQLLRQVKKLQEKVDTKKFLHSPSSKVECTCAII